MNIVLELPDKEVLQRLATNAAHRAIEDIGEKGGVEGAISSQIMEVMLPDGSKYRVGVTVQRIEIPAALRFERKPVGEFTLAVDRSAVKQAFANWRNGAEETVKNFPPIAASQWGFSGGVSGVNGHAHEALQTNPPTPAVQGVTRHETLFLDFGSMSPAEMAAHEGKVNAPAAAPSPEAVREAEAWKGVSAELRESIVKSALNDLRNATSWMTDEELKAHIDQFLQSRLQVRRATATAKAILGGAGNASS